MKRIWYRIADYLRETDKLFIIICVFTSFYGCAAVFSATSFTGTRRQFVVHLFGTIVGFIAAIVISFAPSL